jgi:phosphatidyl-myo-inositol dimannoside synthase
MRILMVTSSYPKFPGDVTAPFIESITQGVVARGHEVDVVLPHHPELRRPESDAVHFFPYRYAPTDAWSVWGYAQSLESDVRVRRGAYLLAPLVALALRRAVGDLLLARRYDAVHVHWVIPNAALLTDVLAAHRVPVVVSVHGSDVFVAERLRFARALAGAAFRGAGAVTACSGDLHQRCLPLGASPERTRTVPYGVDVELFGAEPSASSPAVDHASLRARLGVAPDRRLVFAFGRLVEKKGFRYLVEAAAGMGDRLTVAIAGEGDERSALEQRARDLGAPVRLVGRLDRRETAAALAEADAVVVPSVVDEAGNVDGLPNTLLEAMAAGRPIVASRVAGIPDVVTDGVNGLLVPEKDPRALAAALARLVEEPDTRDRLGREARRTAVTRLTWDAAAAAFEECYVQAATLAAR